MFIKRDTLFRLPRKIKFFDNKAESLRNNVSQFSEMYLNFI